MAAGDLILADRGYCHPGRGGGGARQGGDIIVRLNSNRCRCSRPTGQPPALLPELRKLRGAGTVGEWWTGYTPRRTALEGGCVRCAKAGKPSPRRNGKSNAGSIRTDSRRPETREYAHYVMVFTTLRGSEMGAAEVLEYYRFRWQIELVFKRLKSLLAVGHLPKHDERSSRAWLYGKLLVALLTQKLVRLGASFSPWGYELRRTRAKAVSGVSFNSRCIRCNRPSLRK